MSITLHVLGPHDAAVLDRVDPDVFDGPLDPRWTAEFIGDPRHHMVVALDDGLVVGMVSGVHYLHPDKAPELFVNELGVAGSYRRRGIGRQLLDAILEVGRALGCRAAWVPTDESNAPARALYGAAGWEEAPERCTVFTRDLVDAE